MEESVAMVSSGEVQAPPPSTPATIPPADPAPLPPERTQVSSQNLPYLRESNDRKTVDAPPTLTKDGKQNPAYVDHVIAKVLREHGIEQAKDQPEPPPESLKQFGTMEEIKETLQGWSDFFHTPDGVINALDRVHDLDYPVFEKTVTTIALGNVEFITALYQAKGYLPEFAEPAQPQPLPREIKAAIDESLWATAETLSPNLLRYWQEQGSLEYNLEQKKRLDDQWNEVRGTADGQARAAFERVRQEGQAQIVEISGNYRDAHLKQLQKWAPCGNNEDANYAVYGMVLSGALTELISDPEWREVEQKITSLLANAPTKRLTDPYQAGIDEREAKALVMRFNARLGQLVRSRVMLLNQMFKPKEQPKPEPAPDPEPPRLINGKQNPKWLDWMIRNPKEKVAPGARLDARPDPTLPNGAPNPAYQQWFDANAEHKKVLSKEA